MIHAAEFFTAGELDILQQVSISLSMCVKEWQNRDILYELDRETWKDMSEDWLTYTLGQLSPALGSRHSCLDPAYNARKKKSPSRSAWRKQVKTASIRKCRQGITSGQEYE